VDIGKAIEVRNNSRFFVSKTPADQHHVGDVETPVRAVKTLVVEDTKKRELLRTSMAFPMSTAFGGSRIGQSIRIGSRRAQSRRCRYTRL